MAVMKIVRLGENDVLRKKAHPVKTIDRRTQALIKDMAETMYAAEGVGLAAPQVGILRRCIVIDVGEGLLEMIDPVITAREGSAVDAEGCLSVPDIFGDVERAACVSVEYTTRFNKRKKLRAEKLLARCIQHELDHLDGIII